MTYLRWGFRGLLFGLTLGLLVDFVSYVNGMTKVETAEAVARRSAEQWDYLAKEKSVVMRKVAILQARAGKTDEALETVKAINPENKMVQDSVKNEIVDKLVFARDGNVRKENFPNAKAVAGKIEDPLIRADALARIADAEVLAGLYHDPQKGDNPYPKDAASSSKEAYGLANGAEHRAVKESIVPYILWPVGLALFGFVFGAMFAPCLEAFSGPSGVETIARSKSEEEEDEEEEEEDEEEEKSDELAAAGIMEATMPAPAVAPPPAPAKPAVPAAPAAAKPGATLPPGAAPRPAGAAPAAAQAGSMLQRAGVAPTPGSAPGTAKPTQVGTQGKATQITPQAAATKLAPRGAPTQLAPPEEAGK